MLRFKRRIGLWCCVRGRKSRQNPPSRLSLDFAKPIGRRFTLLFGIAVIHPLMHRISFKVFLPICLSKTH